MRVRVFMYVSLILVSAFTASAADASDWARFRGPNGTGVSPDDVPAPTTWTDTENVKWTLDLPGPGSSCPIVVGDKVFVTCWTGYGLSREEPGEQDQLKRHLICVNRADGKILWDREVDPYLPEDNYGGMFAEHGYASHTPVSDGEKVFVFFGKTGVIAFDMEGKQLWQTPVGTESDPRNWGSASSPILYKNLVIVPASAETHALVALDKETGKEVWKQEAQGFEGTWGSPVLVDANGKKEIAIAVPGELWGFNPETGKLSWYVTNLGGDSCTTSAIAADGMVYLVGGRDGKTLAVKPGGSGDVSSSNVVWSTNLQGGIGTPVLHDGKIYSISREVVTCIDAKTGEELFKKRLEAPVAEETEEPSAPAEGEGQGGGRRGGRGGGFMNQSYSSPVIADGKLYFVTRAGLVYVFKLGDELEQVAVNKLGNDEADFSATPAISDGEIFIRSSKKLYCVAEE